MKTDIENHNEILMVTVLMPVYNGEKYLKEAINSVLNQTYKDFEFLIINDGSTDNTLSIIESYTDPRIRLINNETNIKLIATLNLGLKLASGKYIVRMDCDDVCFPGRIQAQVDYMELNPEVGISGTWFVKSNNKKVVMKPLTHNEIKVSLLRGASILHPTAIFRKEFFDKNNLEFDHQYIHAEDYKLWLQSSLLFKLGNIPKVLLMYRIHPKQVSEYFSKEQRKTTIKLMEEQLEGLGITPSKDIIKKHFNLYSISKISNKQVVELLSYVDLLLEKNEKKKVYDQESLKKFLHPLKTNLWNRCIDYNLQTLILFHNSNFLYSRSKSMILYLKIIKRIITNSLINLR